MLFADFKNKDPAIMAGIEGILRTVASPASRPQAVQNPSPFQIPPSTIGLPGPVRPSSSSTSSYSADESQNSFSPASCSSPQSSISSKTSSTQEPNFLELCVNIGEHLKELGEIDLTSATCDGDFFGAVQDRYLQIRGFRSKFWLLRPATVSFVRVRIS